MVLVGIYALFNSFVLHKKYYGKDDEILNSETQKGEAQPAVQEQNGYQQ